MPGSHPLSFLSPHLSNGHFSVYACLSISSDQWLYEDFHVSKSFCLTAIISPSNWAPCETVSRPLDWFICLVAQSRRVSGWFKLASAFQGVSLAFRRGSNVAKERGELGL